MKPLSAIAALGALAAAPASAAVIPGLFNTGTDSSNVALVGGNGTVDPHYVIFSSTSPGFAGQHAVTFQCCYFPDDANSRWVSLSANGSPGNNVTVYRLTFDLAGLNPATAHISGSGGSDNAGHIFLNGNDTGINIDGFGALVPFAINSGFVNGLNVLDFQVTDFGPPTAFRIDDLAGTANLSSAVPEPRSWALMLAGFGLLGIATRRQKPNVTFA